MLNNAALCVAMLITHTNLTTFLITIIIIRLIVKLEVLISGFSWDDETRTTLSLDEKYTHDSKD